MSGSISLDERPLNLIKQADITASAAIASTNASDDGDEDIRTIRTVLARCNRDGEVKHELTRGHGEINDVVATIPLLATVPKRSRPTQLLSDADVIDLCSDDDDTTTAPQSLSSSDTENRPPTNSCDDDSEIHISSPEFLSPPSSSTASSTRTPPPPTSTAHTNIDRQRKRPRTSDYVSDDTRNSNLTTQDAVRTAITVAAALGMRKLSPPKAPSAHPTSSRLYGLGETKAQSNKHSPRLHTPPPLSSLVTSPLVTAANEFDDEEDDDISRFHVEYHSQEGPQSDESDDEGDELDEDEETPLSTKNGDGATQRNVRETIYISDNDDEDSDDSYDIFVVTPQRSTTTAAAASKPTNVVDNANFPLTNIFTAQRPAHIVSSAPPSAATSPRTHQTTSAPRKPPLSVINVGPPLESLRIVNARGFTLTATPFRTLYTAEPITRGAVGRVVKSKRFRFSLDQLRRRLDEIEEAITSVDERMETDTNGDVTVFHQLTDDLIEEQDMIQDEITERKKKEKQRRVTEKRLWKEYESRTHRPAEASGGQGDDQSDDQSRDDVDDDEDEDDEEQSSDDDVVEVMETEEADGDADDADVDAATDSIIAPAQVCSKFRDLLAANDYYYLVDADEFNLQTAEINQRAVFGPTLFISQNQTNNSNRPSRRLQPTHLPADNHGVTNAVVTAPTLSVNVRSL